ncbi:glycosyltransferase [Polaribacter cellanae]|uniref:Glycosyltransferase family 2 protein n=1 Tax=Polaribacter cellanae TaxID=2818493 RepID=A0A975CKD8_9FLAO|nr:glycosyltransferase family 2 protein [Polaribacter cellanae]QTE21501.1 glycosyltransferase family 2 protein [Polaribacter cellanae]
MKEKLDITASIVLYNENLEELTKTVNCFLNIPLKKKLFLIDNTPKKKFQNIFKHEDITYIATGKNIGFGAGHNVVINSIKEVSNYHLILNPDVFFETNVILNLIKELEANDSLAMIAPKVLFPNGKHQYSCRRYPLISELLARRFFFLKSFFKQVIFKGTYRDKNLNKPFFAEYITGCFHLYNTEDFIKLNGFDERYFLYMEDVDICKKIDALGKKKLYYPNEEIVHVLKQGSSKNINLFLRHISSAIKYFSKWGI